MHPIPSSSMRAFISLLERKGILRRISEKVSWKYQIGEITRRTRIPTLFENIEGYPSRRLFANGLILPMTIALALGLDERTSMRAMARVVSEWIATRLPPRHG